MNKKGKKTKRKATGIILRNRRRGSPKSSLVASLNRRRVAGDDENETTKSSTSPSITLSLSVGKRSTTSGAKQQRIEQQANKWSWRRIKTYSPEKKRRRSSRTRWRSPHRKLQWNHRRDVACMNPHRGVAYAASSLPGVADEISAEIAGRDDEEKGKKQNESLTLSL